MNQPTQRPISLTWLRLVLLISGFVLGSGTWGQSLWAAPHPAGAASAENLAAVVPLPPGCIGGIPTDGEIPVCCISGLVYLNGEPVSGAAVTVQSATGAITVLSQRHPGDEERPYYRVPLSTAPISATQGTLITITVTYAGLQKSVQHTVQDGGQQVDLVFAPTGLAIGGGLDKQPTPGKFTQPRDVAVSSRGYIYALDSQNLRVQVFQTDGTLLNLPKWQKRFGNLPDQWSTETLGLAIDPRTDTVYLADNANKRIARYNAVGDLLGLWDGSAIGDNIGFHPIDVAVDGAGYVYAAVLATTLPGDGSGYHLYKFDPQTDRAVRWGQAGAEYVVFGEPKQLAVAVDGQVYLPDSDNHTVLHFNAAGQLQPFAVTFTGDLAGSSPISVPIGIALDRQGDLYLNDRYRGANGIRPRILKIAVSGQANKAWNYPNFAEQYVDSPWGMAVGADVLYMGDIGLGRDRISRIQINGDFLPPWGETDRGVGQLAEPRGIVVAPATSALADQLLVADCATNRVVAIQATTITHSWNYTDVNQTGRWCPRQLAFDSQNRLLVMDNRDFFLARYQINGNQLVQDGGPWLGKVGNISFFEGYVDFAVDSQNRVYIADDVNKRLVIYTIQDNQTLAPIASFDGIGSSGVLTNPQGIAIDDTNPDNVQIYLSDTGNDRLLKLSFNGNVITHHETWGDNKPNSKKLLCPLPAGETVLRKPKGLLVAPDGNLYVADQNLHRVLKLTQGGVCVQVLGQGNGRAEPGKLTAPEDVAMDSQGILYVSNGNYSGIARFAPPQSTLPVATITHVSANAIALQEGDTLEIIGQGQASVITGSITAFQWSSSLDGVLNEQNTAGLPSTLRLPATALQPGVHQISLIVTDDRGRNSPPATVQVRRLAKLPDTPVGSCNGESWTFLLYLVGDFSDSGALRTRYDQQINRLREQRNPCVRVAIQVDGPNNAIAPSNLTQRIAITPGLGLAVTEMNELKMDEPGTLRDFVRWGQTLFPTDHYYLAIANHGQGIKGIGWDKTSGADEFLTPREIAEALTDPQVIRPDLLHLDACSMGLLDVAYELRDSADLLLASQYIGWGFFAYADYVGHVPADQPIAARTLGEAILGDYARLADQAGVPFTLSLLNPARAEVVKSGLSDLSAALIGWAQNGSANAHRLRELRGRLPTLDSNGDLQNRFADAYLDLVDFAQAIVALNEPAIQPAAQALLNELTGGAVERRLVLAHRYRSRTLNGFYSGILLNTTINLSHTHGISLYFPPERLAPPGQAQAAATGSYSPAYRDYLNLVAPAQDLPRDTRWEDLLYTLLAAPQADEPLVDNTPPLAPVNAQERVFLAVVRR